MVDSPHVYSNALKEEVGFIPVSSEKRCWQKAGVGGRRFVAGSDDLSLVSCSSTVADVGNASYYASESRGNRIPDRRAHGIAGRGRGGSRRAGPPVNLQMDTRPHNFMNKGRVT